MNKDSVRLTIGGVVQANHGTYLQRPVDKQLLDTCLDGAFAYVLACRQIGKSSLMNAVAEDLIKQGFRVARIDLNSIGQDITETEIWYFNLFERLARSLLLETDVEEWWERQPRLLTYSQRFIRFLEDVILSEIDNNIIVFIDEIDVTLGLPFTDDFFATIRTIYNDRALYPAFQRISFVLLGHATPDDLISDSNRTPFNIGHALNMRDFTFEECKPLQKAVEGDTEQDSEMFFREIYEWTNGHPYLTQKLCDAVSKAPNKSNLYLVDNLVNQIFKIDGDNTDRNIRFVERRVRNDPNSQKMLHIYQQILHGKAVFDDKESIAINRLKLYGLVVSQNNRLQPRNRLYREVFDLQWIEENIEPSRLGWLSYPRLIALITIIAWLVSLIWLFNYPGFEAIASVVAISFALISFLTRSDLAGAFIDSRRFRRRYLQNLKSRIATYDTRGLSTQSSYTLELDAVFVMPEVALVSFHQMSGALFLQDTEGTVRQRHNIWEALRLDSLTQYNLVILGSPGSGKTTLLKYLSLALAKEKGNDSKLNMPRVLPILLFLREHADDIAQDKDRGSYTLETAIEREMRKWDMIVPDGWFKRQLEGGNCIILLDGLDEISDPTKRRMLTTWIDRQMTSLPKNRFVITSRPLGYVENPLAGVVALEVLPFNSSQVKSFIHKWYLASEITRKNKDTERARMDAEMRARDLISRINHNRTIATLAVNPLLLTMISTIHSYRASLPERDVELYSEVCNVFLGRRQLAKGIDLDLTSGQKQKVLESLAWYMMQQQVREVSSKTASSIIKPTLVTLNKARDIEPEEFLKQVEVESGLLLEKEASYYGFVHIVFQEYLAAEYAAQTKQSGYLSVKIADPWWHNTIRLYCGLTDATPIIEACIEAVKTHPSIIYLAQECLQAARELSPAVRRQLIELIEDKGDGQLRLSN